MRSYFRTRSTFQIWTFHFALPNRARRLCKEMFADAGIGIGPKGYIFPEPEKLRNFRVLTFVDSGN